MTARDWIDVVAKTIASIGVIVGAIIATFKSLRALKSKREAKIIEKECVEWWDGIKDSLKGAAIGVTYEKRHLADWAKKNRNAQLSETGGKIWVKKG